ncbi:hypothetical protein M3Y98_00811400 [Aphelenchoides besseyi]|nr:hypothetical protein M3Y98_00811400 [Aphelenchoides besseyi]
MSRRRRRNKRNASRPHVRYDGEFTSNSRQHRVDGRIGSGTTKNINLVSEQKNLPKQCNEAVDEAHQRDEEPENQAKIIAKLKNALEQSQKERISHETKLRSIWILFNDLMKTFPHKIEKQ